MSTEGKVTLERHGHVLLIGLDRAAKRNAFDRAMLDALGKAYGELERDADLRCGVLFAHGDHFTAGLELTQFIDRLGRGVQDVAEGALDPLGITGPRLSKPMVCALQGICLTIGIELMLATDIRIAAANTRFAQIEIKRGIYPIGGATIRFVREAGWGNAMRYLLTGDEFSAQEAFRIGLVQEVVEPGRQLARAEEIAQIIAQQAPLGVYATLKASRFALTAGEEEAMRHLAPSLAPLLQSEDAQEGIRSFIERRPANFKGK
ncbi:MAG TPA: crotonase/enoyl-CoA hydratase family protein [Ktedonobacteraceae bacterium]|nr:crotonase/enoyl-CoA hydratase family protein [Ktedonobacteraceae bacterium]